MLSSVRKLFKNQRITSAIFAWTFSTIYYSSWFCSKIIVISVKLLLKTPDDALPVGIFVSDSRGRLSFLLSSSSRVDGNAVLVSVELFIKVEHLPCSILAQRPSLLSSSEPGQVGGELSNWLPRYWRHNTITHHGGSPDNEDSAPTNDYARGHSFLGAGQPRLE